MLYRKYPSKSSRIFTAVAKASTFLDSVRTTPIVQSHSSRSVKLPPITVPLFSGDIQGFNSFFDTFLAVVDTNEDLSEVEKLFYLKQSLRDSAAKCVSGMQMTQANYKIVNNLKSRSTTIEKYKFFLTLKPC